MYYHYAFDYESVDTYNIAEQHVTTIDSHPWCCHIDSTTTETRGATWEYVSGQFFRIFEIIIFCFVVAICDLVHDVETIFHISYVQTASGYLF